jgi:hypothetical protein|nr:MAG TPA: hypothetical protein [Caudoviricetes sp.]
MKKYNLSAIMKRAWELVKKLDTTISAGLKKAWKEAKKTLKGTEKQIKWAEDIIREARETIKNNIANIDKIDTIGIRAIERQCYVECGESLEQMLSQIDDAATIIDMRDKLSSYSINQMVSREENRRREQKIRRK